MMTSTVTEVVSRCPKCAASVEASSRFCRACGTEVTTRPIALRAQGEPEWLRTWQRTVSKIKRWWSFAHRYLLADHSQQWWDVASIMGGGSLGMFWLIYARIRQAQNGWQTAILIFLMPIGMTFARKQLDKLLLPLQSVRQLIPQWGLIAIGVLAPLGITTTLLQIGVRLLGISDERCIQAAMVISTSIAYAVLRTPEEAERANASQAVASPRRLP